MTLNHILLANFALKRHDFAIRKCNVLWTSTHNVTTLFKNWISFFWGLSKCKLHWVACKLCLRPNVVYTSINIRKIKFISHIYIHFNQNVDEKSDISTKIEAGKHLNAVFLLTAEQRQWHHDIADIESDCREPWFVLTSFKVDWTFELFWDPLLTISPNLFFWKQPTVRSLQSK